MCILYCNVYNISYAFVVSETASIQHYLVEYGTVKVNTLSGIRYKLQYFVCIGDVSMRDGRVEGQQESRRAQGRMVKLGGGEGE